MGADDGTHNEVFFSKKTTGDRVGDGGTLIQFVIKNCIICKKEVSGVEQYIVPYSELYPEGYRGRKVHRTCLEESLKLRMAALELVDDFEATRSV